jgi:hypothetical protein
MRRVVVFLGPSLSREEARRRCAADFRPPVAQGDVLRALDDGAQAIGIVDGVFGHVPAVWHKEILVALEAGIHVAGAGSMGALRAAELDGFGMVGIGEVYAQYRSGALEDDDEVAVAHADADLGWRPISEAMVNVRDHCRRAVAARALTEDASAAIVAAAKRMHYPDRRYPIILLEARTAGVGAAEVKRFEAWLAADGPNLKARDAVALLRYLAAPRRRRPERAAGWRLEPTEFLEALRLEVARAGGAAQPAGGAAGRRHRREILLRVLAGREAARQGIVPAAAEVQRTADDFRRRRGLRSRARALRWLRERGLDVEDFTALMESETLIEQVLLGRHWWEVERHLGAERRLRGGPRERRRR